MRTTRVTSLLAVMGAVLAAAFPGVVLAADGAQHDHSHAANSADKSTAASLAPTEPAAVMQQMHVAHEKMMAAKTPAERQAAMAEHD